MYSKHFCLLIIFSFIVGLLKWYNDWKWILIEIEFGKGTAKRSGSEGVYLQYQLFNHNNISSISCLPAVSAV